VGATKGYGVKEVVVRETKVDASSPDEVRGNGQWTGVDAAEGEGGGRKGVCRLGAGDET